MSPGSEFEENVRSSVFLNWRVSFPPFHCPLKKREGKRGDAFLRCKTCSPLCWAVHNWRLVYWISENRPICFIKTIKAFFPAQCVSSFLSLESGILKNVNLNLKEKSSHNFRGTILRAFQADVMFWSLSKKKPIEAKLNKDLQKRENLTKLNNPSSDDKTINYFYIGDLQLMSRP